MKKITAFILVLVLAFGMAAALTSCAGNKNYFYAENIGLSEGVVSYLCSYYKYYYMSSLASQGYQVEDTEAFWNIPYYGLSSTLGDYLKYYGEKYIINLVAANIIFDEYEKLTYDDKVEIELAVNEIIQYYNNGSKAEFRKAVKKYGFNYKDMYSATEMMYKAFILEERVFGDNMEEFSDYYEKFFSEYKRVKFVYVETEDFSEAQNEELENYKNEVNRCIEEIADGKTDASALAAIMEEIRTKYGNAEEHYLHSGTEFTVAFGGENADIVSAALELSVGEGRYIECFADDSDGEQSSENSDSFVGVCFMYCVESAPEAYTDTESKYFKDFYTLAITSLANLKVSEYNERVTVGKKWESFNVIAIPYNSDYVPIFY